MRRELLLVREMRDAVVMIRDLVVEREVEAIPTLELERAAAGACAGQLASYRSRADSTAGVFSRAHASTLSSTGRRLAPRSVSS